MAITLRDTTPNNTGKGSELTYLDMDTNLESFFYSSSLDGGTLTLFTTGSESHSIDLTGVGGGSTTNTGSFYISSSVSNDTITFTQGDTTTEQVTVDNVNSASFALTSSHTPDALVTASLAGSNLTFTKGDSSQFTLALPGGGGGNPIAGSYTGSLLTNSIQSIQFTGAGVLATVGSSNDITVDIPGGGSIDTGSLMVTGSVFSNTLTFTKGDGSTFDLTVDTGSATSINTGSFYLSSSVSNDTITFTQGDTTTEQVTVDNVNSASFALTSSHTPNALVTASLAGSNLTFTKGDSSQFTLALPGGGGGITVDNNVNNYMLTATGGSTINGEANATFTPASGFGSQHWLDIKNGGLSLDSGLISHGYLSSTALPPSQDTTIMTISTATYAAIFIDYQIAAFGSTAQRSGTFMAHWNSAGTVSFANYSTVDIGAISEDNTLLRAVNQSPNIEIFWNDPSIIVNNNHGYVATYRLLKRMTIVDSAPGGVGGGYG